MRKLFLVRASLLIIVPLIVAGCGRKVPVMKVNVSNDIKVGVILPITGENARIGAFAKDGIEIALKIAKDTGGAKNGRKFKVIYEDDGGSPTKAASAMHKLISSDQVSFIIGPLGIASAQAAAKIAEDNHKLMIASYATDPEIAKGRRYVFRVWQSAVSVGMGVNAVARNYGYKKIAMFSTLDDIYSANRKEVLDLIKSAEIVLDEQVLPSSLDFRTLFLKLKNTDYDLIFLNLKDKQIGRAAKQLRELGLDKQILAVDSARDRDIVRSASGGLEDAFILVPQAEKRWFYNAFKSIYKIPPDTIAHYTYDIFNKVLLAMDNAGYKTEDLIDELLSDRNYIGATGRLVFDKEGNSIPKPMLLKQIYKGRVRFLKYVEEQKAKEAQEIKEEEERKENLGTTEKKVSQ